MDYAYGQRYRDLYQTHWWWRAREAALVDVLRKLPSDDATDRWLLDVGCGDGLFFDRLREFGQIVGVEPAGELVSADGPHRSRIHVCPFDDRFQPDRRYSRVLMLDVLEHMDDPVAALRHAAGLLTPDGAIVVTVPAFNALWTSHDEVNHHRIRYTRRTFGEVARKAGVRIDRDEYWFQWTVPVRFAERVLERTFGRAVAGARVPAAPLNRLLYLWSRLERRTLGPLRPPFGTSLLAVCRRPADRPDPHV